MPNGDRMTEMPTKCRQVLELLPWHLNRTLDEAEERTVTEHLDSCDSCRREWGQTIRAAWITDQHVPTRVLTDYAFGERIESFDRSVLERHLERCPSCREEVSLANRSASPREPASDTSGQLDWWPVAVAASLILGLAIGVLWRSTDLPGRPGAPKEGETSTLDPRADVPLVELLPETTLRGETDRRNPRVDKTSSPFVMFLVPLETPDLAERWTARLVDEDGDPIFVLRSAVADAEGALTLLVPTSRLPQGKLSLIVDPAEVDAASGTRHRFVVSSSPSAQPEITKDAQ